ncbi:MAG: hypothetical protein HY646_06635 [Acidobacteria bacterium]|nr:hypothetical protein [Acidobacteriota bacterium]
MNTFLYRTEAKGIQSWILASNRLLEIQGGSTIVLQFEKDVENLARRCGGEVVVAAAGGATLRFRSLDALCSFANYWPLFVSQRAPGLQVVQAWGDRMKDIYRKLGESRNLQFPDLPVAGPLISRSGRTGLPAVRRGNKKKDLEDKSIKVKIDDRRNLLDRMLLGGEQRDFIYDADKFKDGYLGVIHIDGNRVGQRIIELDDDLDSLRKFSDELRSATRTAARNAFDELIRHHAKDEISIQARPIVLGGDDLTVIVHGDYAIPFTHYYLREFERATATPNLSGLTACAGIALVKSGWPFARAHELAEDLCKSAKRRLNRSSGLLFHRVTTADADLRWDRICETELKCDDRVLAGGPWLLDQISKLDTLCIHAGQMPRGALRGWVGECRVSHDRAQARWDRLHEVAVVRGNWKGFANALTELNVDPSSGWNDKGQTPIPDALMWANLQSITRADSQRLWKEVQ